MHFIISFQAWRHALYSTQISLSDFSLLNFQWAIIALSASSLDGGSVSLMYFSQRLKTFKPQDVFDM